MSPSATVDAVWWTRPPPAPLYAPGGAMALDATPRPRRRIGLAQSRVLHGAITEAAGLGHHPTLPLIALAPVPDGLGWAAYVAMDSAARALAGQCHGVHLFGAPVTLRCGPLWRLKLPQVEDIGPRVLRVRTVTPLCLRGPQPWPRPGALTVTLRSWLPRRVGVELDRHALLRTELIGRPQGRVVRVRLGEHLGTATGWRGELVLRTNALGEWLWRLGGLLGVGARVGFGFGRVEVERAA